MPIQCIRLATVANEDEYLLVEEVGRQHALRSVPVYVGLLSYLEVTERDARESLRQRPILAVQQSGYDLDSVQVIVTIHAEEDVQDEELGDGIEQVKQFGDQVNEDQIVAGISAAEEAAHPGYGILDPGTQSFFILRLLD